MQCLLHVYDVYIVWCVCMLFLMLTDEWIIICLACLSSLPASQFYLLGQLYVRIPWAWWNIRQNITCFHSILCIFGFEKWDEMLKLMLKDLKLNIYISSVPSVMTGVYARGYCCCCCCRSLYNKCCCSAPLQAHFVVIDWFMLCIIVYFIIFLSYIFYFRLFFDFLQCDDGIAIR